jgi:hypothetical protein
MQRFGIEDESWFVAARAGLERRGFKLRIQPRSIIIDKEARLPRIIGCAREFLEFAERQGLAVDPAAFEAADRYGDGRSSLAGRTSPSPFETPPPEPADGARIPGQPAFTEPRPAPLGAVEQRLAELRAEQERRAAAQAAIQVLTDEKQELLKSCEQLAAEVARLTRSVEEASKQRDLWQLTASAAEDRLRALQAELDAPSTSRSGDKRFDQLRRFLARELHPDLAGDNRQERQLREALFKRVWAKIEQLQ